MIWKGLRRYFRILLGVYPIPPTTVYLLGEWGLKKSDMGTIKLVSVSSGDGKTLSGSRSCAIGREKRVNYWCEYECSFVIWRRK